MNPFPFPLSDGISFPPKDGFLVKCPSFLKTLSAKPYQKLFASLGDEQKLHTDPVGFSVMPVYLDGRKHFIVGVRVEGFYEHKKTKAKIGSDFNPVFPLEAFVDTLTRFRASGKIEAEETIINTPAGTESERFVKFTMHEIRRLNVDVKAQAEQMTANLNRGPVDTAFLDYRAQNIFGTSSLISIRLNAFDFHVNPDAFSNDKKAPIQIFKKFEKAMHCLQVESRKKSLYIRLDGQSFHSINGHEIFELLPFVLLENAIKYSPLNQEIVVSFLPENGRLQVIVTSIGPLLYAEEQKQLFGRDFRGENAKKTSDGSGAGLHFAKLVCDLHRVNIDARSHQQEKLRLNGVPYSYFVVTLEFER